MTDPAKLIEEARNATVGIFDWCREREGTAGVVMALGAIARAIDELCAALTAALEREARLTAERDQAVETLNAERAGYQRMYRDSERARDEAIALSRDLAATQERIRLGEQLLAQSLWLHWYSGSGFAKGAVDAIVAFGDKFDSNVVRDEHASLKQLVRASPIDKMTAERDAAVARAEAAERERDLLLMDPKHRLDGYRELGATCARIEGERDNARAERDASALALREAREALLGLSVEERDEMDGPVLPCWCSEATREACVDHTPQCEIARRALGGAL